SVPPEAETYTIPFATAGAAKDKGPGEKDQILLPVLASRAYTVSVEPTYTTPFATAGEVKKSRWLRVHRMFPVAASSAYSAPKAPPYTIPFDTAGPVSTDQPPGVRRDQIFVPVATSTAYVLPSPYSDPK